MPSVEQIGILGAGRQALETTAYCREAAVIVAFYAVEPGWVGPAPDGTPTPVFPTDAVPVWARSVPVIAATGDPKVRRRLVHHWSGRSFRTVRGTTAWIAEDAQVGPGCTVASGCCVSSQAQLGSHVIVNLGATISHDCRIGDFVTIGPGCHIAGSTAIGADTTLGIGAVVINGIRVGERVTVGAGGVVTRDVPDGAVVKGVPAR
jgi:sugar O-acyltransferase (sialic acid O-acetyltransferase NeuD family)